MALLWMDGFDIYGPGVAGLPSATNDPAINAQLTSSGYVSASDVRVSTTTRTGYGQAIVFGAGSSIIGNPTDCNIRKAFEPKDEIVVGFAMQYDPTTLDRIMDFLFDNRLGSLTRQCSLYANAQGGFSLSKNGSDLLAASPPNVIFPGVWHYVEVKYRPRKGSAGLVVVRVDGVVVLSFTGSTSQSTMPDQVNMVRFGSYADDFFNATSGTQGRQWLDDLYILDTTGEGFNDFLGDVVVHSLLPAGDAGPNELNQFGGQIQHYTAVDEVGYDDNVSYLYTNTPNQQEWFSLDELPANIIDVLAVSVHVRGKKDSPGLGTLKLKARHDTDLVEGSVESLAIQYTTRHFIMPAAPDGTGWTKSKAEQTEIGFEVL